MERDSHPSLSTARVVALKGVEAEGVLRNENIVRFNEIKTNIYVWKKSKIESLGKSEATIKGFLVEYGSFAFDLRFNEFENPNYDFSYFPHSYVMDLLEPPTRHGLQVYVRDDLIGIVNKAKGGFFHFTLPDTLRTVGNDPTLAGEFDPMQDAGMMTKAAALIEFVDWVDMKFEDIKTKGPQETA